MKNVLTTLVLLFALSFGSFQNNVYALNELNIESPSSIETIIVDWELDRASVQATGSGMVDAMIVSSNNQIMDEGVFFANGSVEFNTQGYAAGTYRVVVFYDGKIAQQSYIKE